MTAMEDEYVPDSKTVPVFEDDSAAPTPKSLMLRLAAPDPATIDPREHGTMLDALPYIDLEYNDGSLREQVDALINDEMSNSTKSPDEYLEALNIPMPETKLLDSDLVRNELDRLAQGRPQQPVDMSRYKVEPPPEHMRDSLDAWRKAVDNAHAQLQATRSRLINLELGVKYGPNAWKTHTDDLTKMGEGFAESSKVVQQDIENTNRKRKANQMKHGDKLRQLEGKWVHAIRATNELEGVCYLLERDIKKLKKRAEKRGLKVDMDVV